LNKPHGRWGLLPVQIVESLEVVFDSLTMTGRHAVREFLQGALLLARRQPTPIGDELLELGLIEVASAVAAGIADVAGGGLGGVRASR
jgi:hypothetical protein